MTCSTDADCLNGSSSVSDTNQECLEYYATCCPTCVTYYDGFGNIVTKICE